MQFKQPEILYFLLLLVIPILVHLFQLKKFKKTPFSNVAFLQKIKLQTRKSSQLKKWLILTTRMLLFSGLIFAFSQPYFSAKNSTKKQHNFIYLDNSLSTNTSGEKGDLLKISIQEIIENANKNQIYSLATNTEYYTNIKYKTLQEKLLKVTKSGKKSNLETIFLRFNNYKKNKTNTLNNLILISDFQFNKTSKKELFTNVTHPFSTVLLKSQAKNNISIDSVFIDNQTSENFKLNIIVRNQGEAKNEIPISLKNNKILVSKRSFSIDKNTSKKIDFIVPKSTLFLGEINLDFNDTFNFDNSFYFVQNSTEKINVLSIGKSSKFLSKIYTKNEFNFTHNTEKNINFNSFKNQQLIILNELDEISSTLSSQLQEFSKNGGYLICIPNLNLNLKSYNDFFSKLNIGKIKNKNTSELKITNINYKHPLLKNVFSKKVTNFQYPYTNTNFLNNLKGSSIINFENEGSFAKEIKLPNSKFFWFSSALNQQNSNFQNSPLIVPVFYNIGLQSLKINTNYYIVDEENEVDVPISLNENEILSIQKENQKIIPLQQQFTNKVTLKLKDEVLKAGFYQIINKKDTVKTIAFNHQKQESNLIFLNLDSIATLNKNMSIYKDTTSLFTDFDEKNKVQWLWKWFLILAIVSLCLEILILKFFKT